MASMETPIKHLTSINITAPPPPPPRLSVSRISREFTEDELLKEKTMPFPLFRPIRQRREDTWVISLFVALQLVAFLATMILNDFRLGIFPCQSLSENPLLGPSASTLDEMGALRKTLLTERHEMWRLFSSPWLHGGMFHLIISLSCVIFVGIRLEQEFGTLRVSIICVLSTITGSLAAALFIQDRPSVTSSGSLFGLVGAMLSGLILNWKIYTKKLAAVTSLLVILSINLILGLMPYINNFSNLGGFVSGFLLGLVLLGRPKKKSSALTKADFLGYEVKDDATSVRFKVDKYVLRIVCLVIFILLFAGLIVAFFKGINGNTYCGWCKYLDCIPSKWWSCSYKPVLCETMISSQHLTLTCSGNGKFMDFPLKNIPKSRIEDLCYLICS